MDGNVLRLKTNKSPQDNIHDEANGYLMWILRNALIVRPLPGSSAIRKGTALGCLKVIPSSMARLVTGLPLVFCKGTTGQDEVDESEESAAHK
jgi:hypothetical protein